MQESGDGMDISFYERTIKIRRYGKPQNLFDVVLNKDLAGIRKWFKTHLVSKEYDRQYHVLMRDLAVNKYNEAIREKGELLKKEFKKQLDRDYLSKGKEVPTIVQGIFSNAVNNRMEQLKEHAEKYYAIACAHHTMVVLPINK